MSGTERTDDYLASADYRGHAAVGADAPGMTAFTHSDGKHYFAWVNAGGDVLMRSEGYASKSARDNGVKSVVNARSMPDRFGVDQAHGKFFAVLKAGNRQEIARSVAYDSEAQARALFTAASAVSAAAPAKSQSVATGGQIKVTQLRSIHGQLANIAASVRGLGLRRRHQSVLVADTRENRGMIYIARHLLIVEQV